MWFCFCAGMSSATLWWRAWWVRGEGRRMGVIQLPCSCVQGTDTVTARFRWAAPPSVGPSVGPRGGGRPRRHGFGQEVRRTGYVPKAQHKSLNTPQECLRANRGSTRSAATGVSRVRLHDDCTGRSAAAVGVAHQPMDCRCGDGRVWDGVKRQDLTPRPRDFPISRLPRGRTH